MNDRLSGVRQVRGPSGNGETAPRPLTDPPGTRNAPDPTLSVVIVTKNEADRVEGCIESVFTAARRAVDSFEVILVDSRSTDGTVERACAYPITVVRLSAADRLSPGAGRRVGARYARGEELLHVDGDMHLTETWLTAAVETLREEPSVAAVRGCLNEADRTTVEDLDTVGGLTLFDAAALATVGGFDPYLRSNEDLDVGLKLTEAGHRIVRLPVVSAVHPVGGGLTEPFRRWRAGYYFGPGQAMRKWLSSPSGLRRLVEIHNYEFALMGWAAIGLASVLSPAFLLGWFALSLVLGAVTVSRLGGREAMQFWLAKTFGAVGLVVGFLRGSRPPKAYPVDAAEVVRRAPPLRHYSRIDG